MSKFSAVDNLEDRAKKLYLKFPVAKLLGCGILCLWSSSRPLLAVFSILFPHQVAVSAIFRGAAVLY